MTKAVVAGVVLSWAVCSATQAQIPGTTLDDDLPVESYRVPVLAADAVSYTFLLAGSQAGHETRQTLWGVAASTFLVGAPVVHLVHGRIGRGLGDLGLRMVGPFIGALVSSGFGSDDESSSVATGFVIGAVVISALDAAVFASGDTPRPVTRQVLAPSLAPVRGGAMVGLGGSF